MSDYYNVTTNNGDAAITAAIANNTKLNITHVAFGDGNGAVPTPSKTRTTLVKEVHRQAITKYSIHPTVSNWLIVEAIIPSDVGGFWIREIGLIADGILISHGSHSPFYKVAETNGVSEFRLKYTINIQDGGVVDLTLDESLIYATQAWVDENYVPRNELVDNLITSDATKPLTAKQGKALQDNKLDKTSSSVGVLTNNNRILKPTDLTLGLQTFFGTYSSDNSNQYCDFLTLNGYGDSTGGFKNAIVFHKKATALYHFQSSYSDPSWTTKKQIAYTDSNITGNAATATKLATTRTIGGVSFDGSANINLPGVNSAGNQSTTGNAATATKLTTPRSINGVNFDGTANITIEDSTKLYKADQLGENYAIYRNIAAFCDKSNHVNKALVIHLPKSKNRSNTMMRMTIKGYNYTDTKTNWVLYLGGYNSINSGWYNPFAELVGTKRSLVTDVRFGRVSDHEVIIIGDFNTDGTPKTNFTLANIVIDEFVAAYSNISGWDASEFTFSMETDLSAYTIEKTCDLGTVLGRDLQDVQGVESLTAAMLAKAPFVTPTKYMDIVDNYAPWLAGQSRSNSGYAVNMAIGAYRGDGWFPRNGMFIATGNSDSKATQAFRFLNSGIFEHTGNQITIPHDLTVSGSINGNSATATKLVTARSIGGVNFDGTANINLPGVNVAGNQSTTGNAATATKLATARSIGGVSFDGSANINLPGVNTGGNQNTTGNAATATIASSCSGNSATATKLATARTIGGVNFDGSANINLPGVNTGGNQNTTGNAATATKLATARTISLTGAAQGSASFDGSGNIAIATEGLGVGQTWQNLTASRSLATTYTNSTGKPIMVSVTWEQSNQGEMTLTVGGLAVDRGRQNQVGGGAAVQAIVPTGATYSVTSSANSIVSWLELR